MSNSSSESSAARRSALTTAFLALLALSLGAWGVLKYKRSEDLGRSLASTQEQLAQAQRLLKETESRLAIAVDQLAEKDGQLAAVGKPDLPVGVTFRSALLGSGLVAIFRNHGSGALEVAAEFSSAATGVRRSANLVLPPNGLKEIGHAEGWAFAAGQHIRLTNSHFRPAEYVVPGT